MFNLKSTLSRSCHQLRLGTAVVQEVIKDLQICYSLRSWCAFNVLSVSLMWGQWWYVSKVMLYRVLLIELCYERTSQQSQHLNYSNALSK